jgi:hypothetical protein
LDIFSDNDSNTYIHNGNDNNGYHDNHDNDNNDNNNKNDDIYNNISLTLFKHVDVVNEHLNIYMYIFM